MNERRRRADRPEVSSASNDHDGMDRDRLKSPLCLKKLLRVRRAGSSKVRSQWQRFVLNLKNELPVKFIAASFVRTSQSSTEGAQLLEEPPWHLWIGSDCPAHPTDCRLDWDEVSIGTCCSLLI